MKTSMPSTFLFIVLAFGGCHTYKEYDKKSFPGHAWAQDQPILFKPVIEDTQPGYELSLGIRHLYGFQFKALSLQVRMKAPSGKETVEFYTFNIKDKQGKYLGKCAGDICDLETVINENLKLEEVGEYTFIITHDLRVNKIPGVMEIGLILDKK